MGGVGGHQGIGLQWPPRARQRHRSTTATTKFKRNRTVKLTFTYSRLPCHTEYISTANAPSHPTPRTFSTLTLHSDHPSDPLEVPSSAWTRPTLALAAHREPHCLVLFVVQWAHNCSASASASATTVLVLHRPNYSEEQKTQPPRPRAPFERFLPFPSPTVAKRLNFVSTGRILQ